MIIVAGFGINRATSDNVEAGSTPGARRPTTDFVIDDRARNGDSGSEPDFPFHGKYHFEFLCGDNSVGEFRKKTRFRDHYLLRIEDPALDQVLLIARAGALDVLQSQ